MTHSMLKKVFSLFLGMILTLSFAGVSLAKDNPQQLPEVDGVYNVPGHPKLKLRVIVHKARGTKPTPTPTPTCNITDPDSTAQVTATGWHLPANWTYSLNISSAPSGVRSNLPTIAQNSFTVWNNNTSGLVNITRGADTAATTQAFDGQNIVVWNRITPSALAITYTWYDLYTGVVQENDTIMNKRYSWSWTPYAPDACLNTSTYDAQNILTHEIGHWMGLSDEYDATYIDHTMYGYGTSDEIKKDTLTTGDITGLQQIYH